MSQSRNIQLVLTTSSVGFDQFDVVWEVRVLTSCCNVLPVGKDFIWECSECGTCLGGGASIMRSQPRFIFYSELSSYWKTVLIGWIREWVGDDVDVDISWVEEGS